MALSKFLGRVLKRQPRWCLGRGAPPEQGLVQVLDTVSVFQPRISSAVCLRAEGCKGALALICLFI